MTTRDHVARAHVDVLDLGTVETSLAGPRRPQDRVSLTNAATEFDSELPRLAGGVDKPRHGG